MNFEDVEEEERQENVKGNSEVKEKDFPCPSGRNTMHRSSIFLHISNFPSPSFAVLQVSCCLFGTFSRSKITMDELSSSPSCSRS